jgi:AcrR family transcriptional regulator
MQEENRSRSNRDRTAATRALLIDAGKRLFTRNSFAGTGTPELVEAAGVTRGALYHHFEDKKALFSAVVEAEAAAIAQEIELSSQEAPSTLAALMEGTRAYLAAMRAPGRTRLLLLDGPAVLGREAMDAIDAKHGARTLREGLEFAISSGAYRSLPLDALTSALSAAMDRAALSIEQGAAEDEQLAVLAALLDGLAARE